MSAEAATLLALDKLAFYERFASQGARPDGRSADACRATAVRVGVLSRAATDGSSSVRLGATAVLASVACLALPPPPRWASSAVAAAAAATPPPPAVRVALQLPELRGGRTQSSAGSARAGELAALLTQLFGGAGCLDRSSLDVDEEESDGDDDGAGAGAGVGAGGADDVILAAHAPASAPRKRRRRAGWALQVDLVCTSYDGGLADASLLAASAALRSTLFPRPPPRRQGGPAPLNAAPGPLFRYLPVALTLARMPGGLGLVSDPSAANGEDAPAATQRGGGLESAADASLASAGVTVVVAVERPLAGPAPSAAPACRIVAMRAHGGGPALAEADLQRAVVLARRRGLAVAAALWGDGEEPISA